MFSQTSLLIFFVLAIIVAIIGIITGNNGSDTDDDFLKPI